VLDGRSRSTVAPADCSDGTRETAATQGNSRGSSPLSRTRERILIRYEQRYLDHKTITKIFAGSSANATTLGFTFAIVPDGTNGNAEIPSALSLPGTHTSIQIPGGQPSGAYQIKANASAATDDVAVLATYFSSSTAATAVTTDAANYKVGDTVILSGLVFDGTTPITGATVTATVSAPVSLAAQTSLGSRRKS
jgi:hypothetical protein